MSNHENVIIIQKAYTYKVTRHIIKSYNNCANAKTKKKQKNSLKAIEKRDLHESDSAAFNAHIVWTRCWIWCTQKYI